MQAVSIQTTQNIQLEYPLAGIGERLLAFLIDAVIIFSIYALINFVFDLFNIIQSLAVGGILGLIVYLYRLLSEVFMNGQTVGKMALSIKVVKLDGSTPSFAAYFLRWLLEPIDFFIVGLGVLFIILTKNGQRVGDLLAGTTVVKIKKITATNVQNKILMDVVDENYEPQIFEAANISDGEVQIIKDALKAFKNDAVKKPVELVERKLKEKYNIQSDLPTVKFLYTLLRDHTYYVTR
ncbi:RDD family protein [Roseivirga sp. E12]|uniref:RDD family protein n=1 Tax=Roseivirga sp. E12 TaxID=2819237 RepID=UPI001ABD3485|nr:RDD family protein [Roseivirga sp. E12]MBO3699486.1 RDD family protein [Roseivirga sp. E12]